jgi:hypothetical protein
MHLGEHRGLYGTRVEGKTMTFELCLFCPEKTQAPPSLPSENGLDKQPCPSQNDYKIWRGKRARPRLRARRLMFF